METLPITILWGPVTSEPTTVFLIESSDETRDLVAGFLDRSGLIRVVGTANDPSSAMVALTEVDPDVVVIDKFPGPELSADGLGVVIHATTVPERTAGELQRAGIRAIVFKEVGMLDDLINAVLQAAGRFSQR